MRGERPETRVLLRRWLFILKLTVVAGSPHPLIPARGNRRSPYCTSRPIQQSWRPSVDAVMRSGDRPTATGDVFALTSHLSPLTSHLSTLNSQLSPLTSHLSTLTSHLSPLNSHLSPLTSQLSTLTSQLSTLNSQLLWRWQSLWIFRRCGNHFRRWAVETADHAFQFRQCLSQRCLQPQITNLVAEQLSPVVDQG